MSTELRDWQAAMSLAAAWRHGQCPGEAASPVALDPGEVASAVIQCTVLRYGGVRLVTPWPVWFDVALNVVGYHRLPPLRPPAHLARRLGRVDP